MEQEKEQKKSSSSGVVYTLNNWYYWYWEHKRWISGNVNNHPEIDKGTMMETTLAKPDRQKHLKMGLTIHSKSGRPYLLGTPMPSKKRRRRNSRRSRRNS